MLGHSAGAVLALLAAGAGLPMKHLFASEPPLRFGEDEPPADLAERLQTLVDRGHHAEAVVTFQRENVRLPEPMIEQLRGSPVFPGLVPLAQTTVYDTLLVASVSTPTPAMLGTTVPTTILRGEPTAPVLVTACDRLAAAMPRAELVVRRTPTTTRSIRRAPCARCWLGSTDGAPRLPAVGGPDRSGRIRAWRPDPDHGTGRASRGHRAVTGRLSP